MAPSFAFPIVLLPCVVSNSSAIHHYKQQTFLECSSIERTQEASSEATFIETGLAYAPQEVADKLLNNLIARGKKMYKKFKLYFLV